MKVFYKTLRFVLKKRNNYVLFLKTLRAIKINFKQLF